MQNSGYDKLRYKNRKIYKPPPAEDYSSNFKKLIIVIIISFIFIAGQFIGGYISGSISVISDAFHLLTDLIGFLVSFIFIWFSRKKPNEVMTFGYHRMELIGALGNLFIIWALAAFLIYEATDRIIQKEFVKEPTAMLIVAGAGLPINIIMYFVLHSGSSHSHGLMGQQCGEEFHTNENQTSMCSQMICEDIQCLINNEYLEHCHKQKMGENTQEIHKHKNKVQVEGNKVIRLPPIQIEMQNMKNKGQNSHDHSNCKDHHHEEEHKHGENCDHTHKHHKQKQEERELDHQKHEHEHGQCQGHDHDHKHSHAHRSHSANAAQNNKVSNNTLQNTFSKINDDGHNHKGHDHDHHHGHGHGHDHDHDHDHEHGHGHSHQSMSMKAAILHALSDVIQSIGLLISALFIFFLGSNGKPGSNVQQWNNWHYFDPISTYIFSIIVIASTWPITKNCYYIIMESTPAFYDIKQLTEEITAVEGVVDVHDLHIWDLRPGKTILIAHVFSRQGQERNVLKKLTDLSRKKRIYHSTFQVEEEQWKNHQEYILCEHDIH